MKTRWNKIAELKLDRYSRAAIFCLIIILVTGLFSNWIANSRPLYFRYNNKSYFPVFSKQIDRDYYQDQNKIIEWPPDCSKFSFNHIFAPVPYSAGQSDLGSANYKPPLTKYKPNAGYVEDHYCSPNQFRHWLGTNLKGEDLLSGLIHGTSVSLKIGLFSISIALIIGILMGLVAGYFQNDTLKVPLLSFIFMLLSIVPSFYLADIFSFLLEIYAGLKSTYLFTGIFIIYLTCLLFGMMGSYYVGKLIHVILKWKKFVAVPVDTIVSRLIEIFAAVPKLMLVVALAAILERSVTNVIIVIGISSWAGIARLVRAETLKIRNQDFITSAKALGLKNRQIIFRHVLPNISGPIIVSFVFGLSAAILIESGLSFLNMGVPEHVVTWGQLLADGKKNFSAWWLIVFPGLAVFITVLCLNILGEKFKTLLDPRNRSFS